MIDTVRYEQRWKLRQKPARGGLFTLDKKSDLRVNVSGEEIRAVEVSLPKLLFQTNGKLIHTQKQISKAFAEADKIIATLADPIEPERRFTRVDLVWHLRTSPQTFFLAHQHCNHPDAQTKISLFRNLYYFSGIQWEGDRIHIKFYDKTSRKFQPVLRLVRVEIQLRGRRLQQKLNCGSNVRNLDLFSCYRTFRNILLKFRPKNVPTVKKKDEALCYAESKGIPVFEMLSRSMDKKSLSRLRGKFRTYAWREHKIDWEKLLPQNSLPPKYNVGKAKAPKLKFRVKKRSVMNRAKKFVFRSHLPSDAF